MTTDVMNSLNLRLNHWVMQSFLTLDSMDRTRTIYWKAVEQYFTVKLFVFQFYPVCDFGKFINLALGTIRSERVIKKFLKGPRMDNRMISICGRFQASPKLIESCTLLEVSIDISVKISIY